MRHIHDGIAEPAAIAEPALESEMEDEIQATLVQAVRLINRELEYQDDEREPYTLESPIILTMGAWMRRGVRACIARFKGRDACDVMWLGEQLDAATGKYQRGEDGDRLVVRVHEKDMEFTIIHKPTPWSAYH